MNFIDIQENSRKPGLFSLTLIQGIRLTIRNMNGKNHLHRGMVKMDYR